MTNCPYCDPENREICLSPLDDGSYCTRVDGHSGVHVRCTLEEHNVERWYGEDNCPFCQHDKDYCLESKIGFKCTRKIGHKGVHVACGTSCHVIEVWN